MQRIAFLLRIKPEKVQEYDEVHRRVWPELLEEMESMGISDYSIFRRGQQLFLYMKVRDFATTMEQLAASEVNRRWQQKMAVFFEVPDDLEPGEPYAMLREVFFMPGRNDHHSDKTE